MKQLKQLFLLVSLTVCLLFILTMPLAILAQPTQSPIVGELHHSVLTMPTVITFSRQTLITPSMLIRVSPHISTILELSRQPLVNQPLTMTHPAHISSALRLSSTYQLTPSLIPTPPLTIRQADRALFVHQPTQRMYVYEQKTLRRIIPVSTGQPTPNTLTRSWLGQVGDDLGAGRVFYGFSVDYKWFLREGMYGNILIHSVPYTSDGTSKYYDQADALGVRPASHGCIRIGDVDAEWLKAWNPTGAQIRITPAVQ
ncbi:L,D-transpeptidase [Anaerolineales bacterium HSG6]|nr:L,D-transpeptidase [Anaerolineales bacterium HSG6]